MDTLTDIFQTMRVTALVHSRMEATAPWGLSHRPSEAEAGLSTHLGRKISPTDLATFVTIARGNCWLSLEGGGTNDPIPLTGGDCFLIGAGIGFSLRDALESPVKSLCQIGANRPIVEFGGGGVPTTILSGLLSFETPSVRPMTRLLQGLILIRADQAQSAALHTTLQLLAAEMRDSTPGSEAVANRLAEVLFIQAVRAHISSGGCTHRMGWLNAIFDPQIGAALTAVHRDVRQRWTVESMAAAAGMSRSAFAGRFKELVGRTPLDYVTEWRMQKAIGLFSDDAVKQAEVAHSVGYESGAAFSKAFKRVMGAAPGEYRNANL